MKNSKLVSILVLLAVQVLTRAATATWSSGPGHNDHLYVTVSVADGVTWSNAESTAITMGGHLASITSEAENQFVYSLVSADSSLWAWEGGVVGHPGIGPWLGGYLSGSSYLWSDGDSFGYSNWATGEPNHFAGVEGCIEFYSSTSGLMNSTWNDYPNDTTLYPGSFTGPNPHGMVVEIVPEASTSGFLLFFGAVFTAYRYFGWTRKSV